MTLHRLASCTVYARPRTLNRVKLVCAALFWFALHYMNLGHSKINFQLHFRAFVCASCICWQECMRAQTSNHFIHFECARVCCKCRPNADIA